MKKRFSLTPKQIQLYILLILAFITLTFSLFFSQRDKKRLATLTKNLFLTEMTANTLNMHYAIAKPEDYGIPEYTPVLPTYQAGTSDQALQELTDTLQTLSLIRESKLDSGDAYLYKLLTKKMENHKNLASFPYYEEPLSPSSGVQSQLPILFAEYTFRSKRDVEDYLSLLNQTDSYLDSLLTYEQEKSAAGFSQSSYSLEEVKKQCDTLLTPEALEEGNHFLQTTFKERLAPLLTAGQITPQDAKNYLTENNRLLRTVMQPAYERLADGLFLLEDTPGTPDKPYGLATLPQGREYYEQLLIAETGSYLTIAQIKELLAARQDKELHTMQALLAAHPSLRTAMSNRSYETLSFEDAPQMLADLQKRMRTDFPPLPKIPDATIKQVSKSLEDYCAPAFYLTVPLDDTDSNVIYINDKTVFSDSELYTTLAHEGFPGHLYQTVYHNEHAREAGEDPVRSLLWYGGYLEGWALYVEFESYDYLADLLKEEHRDLDAVCVQMEQANRSLLLSIYANIDIMIHYDNATLEEVSCYLQQYGVTNSAAVSSIYNYIADEPCNYLKYYLGYLEILHLKELARECLQEDYSDYAFHRILLDAGPSDFATLEDLFH